MELFASFLQLLMGEKISNYVSEAILKFSLFKFCFSDIILVLLFKILQLQDTERNKKSY